VDRFHIVVAALKALADQGQLPATKVDVAITKYGIDPNKVAPWLI
jgi:pyruvate dehydrogenase E1 component